MSTQLLLPVGLRDGNTFDTFLPAANPQALAAVESLLAGRESCVYLWGPTDAGRTHLLEAAATAVAAGGRPVAYLAAGALREQQPEVLAGLGDTADLVAIDDIDRFAGDRLWEEAFFHLFNAIRARGAALLAAAAAPPRQTAFVLPDLQSRLGSGLVVALQGLDDDGRRAVLAFRAARRGLDLPAETLDWLLARSSRRLADLVSLLAVLEREASIHKRRLTVPFVRQVTEARR